MSGYLLLIVKKSLDDIFTSRHFRCMYSYCCKKRVLYFKEIITLVKLLFGIYFFNILWSAFTWKQMLPLFQAAVLFSCTINKGICVLYVILCYTDNNKLGPILSKFYNPNRTNHIIIWLIRELLNRLCVLKHMATQYS